MGDKGFEVVPASKSSQPPSLENPFVGVALLNTCTVSDRVAVSTSKPGESLCGSIIRILKRISIAKVSTSKPGESLCGIYFSTQKNN